MTTITTSHYDGSSTNLSNAQLLQAYLALTVVAHYACLFFNGYSADLGYWFDWISQLSNRGYQAFNANYPPLYVHWIFTVSKIFPLLGVALENNLLMKSLLELPTLICHLTLVLMINSIMGYANIARWQRHCVLLLTAVNPAILFNGPIWGQVDLIPVTFALASILLHFSPRYRVLSVSFYMLAILTKFQMICFAPVMGVLFFRQLKAHLIGIVLGALVIVIAFAPFIYHHEFARYFKQAYINTLGEYAYTTLNAANLWMLISGNVAPDSYTMFTLYEGTRYEHAISAKNLGMGMFALVSLLIFIRGISEQYCKKMGDTTTQVQQILFYGLICSLAFFTLLPAMHERYLFPAVVMALAYAAINPQRMIYTLLVSIICAANMVLINGINGSDIWLGLSSLMVFTMALALVEFFFGRPLYIFISDMLRRLTRLKWLGLWTFIAGSYLVIGILAHHYRLLDIELDDNQMLLTEMPIASASQTHGSLHINKSFDGHALSVGDQRYANGLGTHTFSSIDYVLPAGATHFSFIVGVDDEVGSADMQFSVWGDGKILWQSKVLHGFEPGKTEKIDITNVSKLNLRVEAVTDMQFDHADWINPVITFDHDIKNKSVENKKGLIL